MIVSIINLSEGALGDARLQKAIRAVNRQLKEDFEPSWGFSAQLRLEGKTGRKKSFDATDMRGDAILYVRQRVRASQDAGYHDKHYSGIPYGFVYLDLAVALDESWTITLSHEALELVGDPSANLLVQGPIRPKSARCSTGSRCAMRCRTSAMRSTASRSAISSSRCISRRARNAAAATTSSGR